MTTTMRTRVAAVTAALVVALVLTVGPASHAGAQTSTHGEVTTQQIAQSPWSQPACVYLYICVQASVSCVEVGYDVLCTAYARSFFAPPGWSISVNAKLFFGGFPAAQLGTHTKDCGTYRDAPQFGVCVTSASALAPTNGLYVSRAVAWRNGDPRPRPIAIAKLYL